MNAHDVDGLCALMTRDHVFVDNVGEFITGHDALRQAWQRYFELVPDYVVHIEHVLSSGNRVALLGRARGTLADCGRLDPENCWEVPAAWQAVIVGDAVSRWQVYADTEPVRRIMQRVAPKTPGDG